MTDDGALLHGQLASICADALDAWLIAVFLGSAVRMFAPPQSDRLA